MLGTYHGNYLFDILKEIHFLSTPQQLWDYVLKKSCEALLSEASTLYELQPQSQNMIITAATGVDAKRLQNFPFTVGKGICGWVAEKLQPAIVPDVRKDPRFYSGVDVVTGFRTRSSLCVPIMAKERPFGVLEVMNRKSGMYSPQDQEFLLLLARQTAAVHINLKLMEQVNRSRDVMESILQGFSGGLIVMDQERRLLVNNGAADHLLQTDLSNQVGKAISDALAKFPWFAELLQKTLESQAAVSRQETMLTIQDKPTKLGYTTFLAKTRDGRQSGAGVIFQILPH